MSGFIMYTLSDSTEIGVRLTREGDVILSGYTGLTSEELANEVDVIVTDMLDCPIENLAGHVLDEGRTMILSALTDEEADDLRIAIGRRDLEQAIIADIYEAVIGDVL